MHRYSTLEKWLYVTMAWVAISDRRRDKVGREGQLKRKTDAKKDPEREMLWRLNLLLQIRTAVINWFDQRC